MFKNYRKFTNPDFVCASEICRKLTRCAGNCWKSNLSCSFPVIFPRICNFRRNFRRTPDAKNQRFRDFLPWVLDRRKKALRLNLPITDAVPRLQGHENSAYRELGISGATSKWVQNDLAWKWVRSEVDDSKMAWKCCWKWMGWLRNGVKMTWVHTT